MRVRPMTRGALRAKLRLLRAPLVALLGYYLLLFAMQRSLLYPAPTGAFEGAIPSDAKPVTLESASGQPVHAWYLPPDAEPPRAVVFFCHGNAERAEDWLAQFRPLRAAGLAVVVLEYPGYGVAPGDPTEESLTAAALAAFDWVRRTPGLADVPVVAYGRSLGGGVATRLATRRTVAALILESTFTDLRSFASDFLAPGFLVRDRYDNVGELRRFRGPLLVLHGERDDIAPFAGGESLARTVGGAELVTMPCGHNDCATPWPTILAFLRSRGLLPPAA
ncbi:MAG TPA: alpha/beta hydrolase [Gemmatimonadaceae bacterium]|nr:alpha/beta hydrolase [Gemmatimonadaceae bacterium]